MDKGWHLAQQCHFLQNTPQGLADIELIGQRFMVSLPIICIVCISMAQQRKGTCKEHHTRHLITSRMPMTGGPWA